MCSSSRALARIKNKSAAVKNWEIFTENWEESEQCRRRSRMIFFTTVEENFEI